MVIRYQRGSPTGANQILTILMKYNTIKNAALALLILAGASQLSADFYSFNDGSPIAGNILRINGDDVTIVSDSGKSSVHDISAFDEISRTRIESWRVGNPEKADVHTKWDKQPIIVSNKLPQLRSQSRDQKFNGKASVELILDESGNVLSAAIKSASHDELKVPTIEATKAWKFQPAVVDGQPVKSKLRVPFSFVNAPQEEVRMIDQVLPYSEESSFAL